MSRAGASEAAIDPAILREAADWLTRLHEGDTGPAEWAAIERWRATSPAHGQAWQRAETLMGELRQLPAGPLRTTLGDPATRRRRLLRLAWLPMALPAGWLAWQQVREEGERWRSATGEQRPLTLADGSRVLLNTGTRIVVSFDAQVRAIRLLEGEILVTSAPDPSPAPRPLRVVTADGTVSPIGTRFSVRRAGSDAASRVAVFEGAVDVDASGHRRRVRAGQRLDFGAGGFGTLVSDQTAVDEAWVNGMIVARRMRLADLVAELDRYRPGLLRCHPEVADLKVSGTFPALDPERSLRLLVDTFPVRVRQRTGYWATVEPDHPDG